MVSSKTLTAEPHCDKCGATLETDAEYLHGICEGCAIDAYEELMRRREQAYLEDDRNWPDFKGER